MPHERCLPVFPLNVPIYTVWQDVMDGAGDQFDIILYQV